MREAQVAELVSFGFTNLQIVGVLHIEEDTVKKHVSHAMAKVGLAGRTPLAVAGPSACGSMSQGPPA